MNKRNLLSVVIKRTHFESTSKKNIATSQSRRKLAHRRNRKHLSNECRASDHAGDVC